ncbi:TrmH family RNA methyltransferase [Allonocardiopsis opalescens]|uniref:tRNA G18 (Ribose-2'-O)-methylase SpoU n=1 Tax=Allonocardiopsis opalescens TaxID=1144618 RepID=A0A2T0PVL5_9ACTN|nr:RNA methyltransferase [Allonocardiopsis opalescens]PRX95480.1 tRNA G18 (ribose-2'-O)-methylase SpoU [Allonocardiopsis opalescens]
MGTTEITDPADPRLADYVRLRDVSLRRSLEAEHGLFLAEGETTIERARTAGYRPRSFLFTSRRAAYAGHVAASTDAPVYLVPDSVAEGLTGFPVHRGALASFHRRRLPEVADVLAGRRTAGVPGRAPAGPARRVLVLEDLVDHGNVGAVFRCAAALGVDAVVLAPRCADPLYRRSVKVSMGAVFAIPYARMADWHGGLAEIRAHGFQLLALTPAPSACSFDDVALDERVALMLGSEGDGLSSHWLEEADLPVRIPMSAEAMSMGVDSLNVVAAAAIACHSLTR